MEYLRPIARKLFSENSNLSYKLDKASGDYEILSLLSKERSDEEIGKLFHSRYGFDLIRVSQQTVNYSLLRNFDVELLKTAKSIPVSFDEETKEWTFAISNLVNDKVQSIFRKITANKNEKSKFVFAFDFEIESFFSEIEEKEDEKPIEESGKNAMGWVDAVIEKGLELRASDIHIERLEKGIRVRYRVDGGMMGSQFFQMSDKQVSNVYVRLKVVGNMNISEKRRSQDGRIDNFKYNGVSYSMRVSTVNTIYGEKFVMRVFDENSDSQTFEDLGFHDDQISAIERMLKKANGIIYLAGATGSGKTTTLYSMIEKLDKEALNIYTIENPSEKTIAGVNQIQVDEQSQNTYPSVLKTLLRQDPDVMVVGEVRESETANIAVQASLTGHLVITTIHANNALDSITRLSELQVESYLLGASSVGFLSQRLVKVLCPHCKKKVDNLPHYHREWIATEFPEFNYEEEKKNGNFIFEPVGCDKCVNGFKGRIAVLELIEVDDKIRELISKKADKKELSKYLKTKDYKEMKFRGIQSALKGLTGIEELMGKLANG